MFNKNFNLTERGLAFALSFWEVISKPWNDTPERSGLVCLGAMGQPASNN